MAKRGKTPRAAASGGAPSAPPVVTVPAAPAPPVPPSAKKPPIRGMMMLGALIAIIVIVMGVKANLAKHHTMSTEASEDVFPTMAHPTTIELTKKFSTKVTEREGYQIHVKMRTPNVYWYAKLNEDDRTIVSNVPRNYPEDHLKVIKDVHCVQWAIDENSRVEKAKFDYWYERP